MRLVCLLLLASAAASAQPADSVAVRRPVLSSLLFVPSGFAASPDDGNLIAFGVRYMRSVGPAPVVAEIGATGSLNLSVFDVHFPLSEAHLAVGVAGSGGPVLLSAVAGPSVARVQRPRSVDPDFEGDRSRIVPGLFAAVRGTLVVFPAFGIGAEAFAHANAEVPTVGFGVTLAFGRMPGSIFPKAPPTPRRPGP